MKMKIINMIVAVSLALTLSLTLFYSRGRATSSSTSIPRPVPSPKLVAGPGRVEPLSEDIQLGSELSGKLRVVNVEEGEQVRKDQVLAVLENDDYRAQVLSAEAEVRTKEATLRKILNGARAQERSEALASVRAAQAVMDNAQSDMERRQKLYAEGVISREEFEHYRREYDVAKAQHQESVERHSLVDDRAREEDVAFGEEDLQLARARLEEAQARYRKTYIKSPINGTVLRKHHRNGESVSNSSTAPDPVLTIGDTRVSRVRVDVDETDVNKVRIGQKTYVTADAFSGQKFWGKVVRVGQLLGPKNVRTDAPTERKDTKILETLVELDQGAQLPMGLRVDAYIIVDNAKEASSTNYTARH